MKDRPIQDAGAAVQAAAEQARAMLIELQAGWLWQLLTIKTKQQDTQ